MIFGNSQDVEGILEGLRQPEWRIPLDMVQSQTLRKEIEQLRSTLAAREAEIAVQRDFNIQQRETIIALRAATEKGERT